MAEKIVMTTTRRLTQISGSSYVALPPDWIRYNELDSRKTVSLLIDSKGRIIIIPNNDRLQ